MELPKRGWRTPDDLHESSGAARCDLDAGGTPRAPFAGALVDGAGGSNRLRVWKNLEREELAESAVKAAANGARYAISLRLNECHSG